MAGQAAGHLLAQTGAARAPWPITTIVSCLPVLVLAMGTTLAHMLRADTAGRPDTQTSGPEPLRSACRPAGRPGADQDGPDRDHAADSRSAPPARAGTAQLREPGARWHATRPQSTDARPRQDEARLVARRLAAAGKPISRRALRSMTAALVSAVEDPLEGRAALVDSPSRTCSASTPTDQQWCGTASPLAATAAQNRSPCATSVRSQCSACEFGAARMLAARVVRW
jgi:hypothetical protein